jgi:hypothetical protein
MANAMQPFGKAFVFVAKVLTINYEEVIFNNCADYIDFQRVQSTNGDPASGLVSWYQVLPSY